MSKSARPHSPSAMARPAPRMAPSAQRTTLQWQPGRRAASARSAPKERAYDIDSTLTPRQQHLLRKAGAISLRGGAPKEGREEQAMDAASLARMPQTGRGAASTAFIAHGGLLVPGGRAKPPGGRNARVVAVKLGAADRQRDGLEPSGTQIADDLSARWVSRALLLDPWPFASLAGARRSTLTLSGAGQG